MRPTLTYFLLLASFLLLQAPYGFAQPSSCWGDTVLYEDFKNGIQGNNGLGAWDTNGMDAHFWEYDLDGPDSLDVDPLNSPTSGNGFMTFDLYEKHGGWFAFEDIEGYLESPVMDLSSTPNAQVSFYTSFRHCCSEDFDIFLDISLDGGLTWTDSLNLSTNVDRDVFSPNPYKFKFDLTEIIDSNASNVKLRFSWDASMTGSGGYYSSDYYFSIDDILVKNANLNDLKTTKTYYGTPNSFQLTGAREYKQIPYEQRHPMVFYSEVCNVGRNNLLNMNTSVQITEMNSGSSFARNSTPNPIDSLSCQGAAILADQPGPFEPSDTGEYKVAYSVGSDSVECDTSNNQGPTEFFQVTSSLYALDNFRKKGVTGFIAAPSDGVGGAEEMECLNEYIFYRKDSIRSISFYAHPDTTKNGAGPIRVKIFNSDLQLQVISDPIFIDNTDPARDTGMITVEFNSLIPVPQGDTIYAGVRYEGGSGSFGVGTSGLAATADYSLKFGNYGGNGKTYYGTVEVPIVRLNVQNPFTVNISNLSLQSFELGQNRPNPFYRQTNIPYELGKSAKVQFQVFDITGQRVMDIDKGKEVRGKHQIRIDGGQLDAGLYYYSLIVNGERKTKKMVLTE